MNTFKEKYIKKVEQYCKDTNAEFEKACDIYEKITPLLKKDFWIINYQPHGKLEFWHYLNPKDNPYESFREFRYLVSLVKQVTGKDMSTRISGIDDFYGIIADCYVEVNNDLLVIAIYQYDTRACQVEIKEEIHKIPVLHGKCLGE